MAAGYIYVLVNSSMPGLVKVGKTRRLPSERVQELSSATGVATPFVVAFEEWCEDCDQTEKAVHAELEQRGFRLAQNREFFLAAANDIIRIILRAAERTNALYSNEETIEAEYPPHHPWDGILVEADAIYEGEDESFQDIDEAIRLYKLAARMGSSEACCKLGSIYFYGSDIPENHDEALKWFKEGVKLGGDDSYVWMGRLYCVQGHFENAKKAFRKFFEGINRLIRSGETEQVFYSNDILQYVYMCLDYRLPIEFPEFIGQARDEILSRVIPRLTDRISVQEREELTRVRNILVSTIANGHEENGETKEKSSIEERNFEKPLAGVVKYNVLAADSFSEKTKSPSKGGWFSRLFGG